MQTLLQIGVSNAIAAAVLALAALALSAVCRKPAVTRGLWLLVLLKLITPAVWTIHCNWPLAQSNDMPSQQVADTVSPQAPVTTGTESGTLDLPAETPVTENDPANDAQPNASLTIAEQRIKSPDPVIPSNGQTRWLDLTLSKIPIIWDVGTLACLLLATIRIAQVRRIFSVSHRAPVDVQIVAGNLADRFGVRRGVEVWFVPGAVCPTLWAFSRTPRILLPRKLWEQLDGCQRSAVIAHELAHLLRRDHWVRLIELAATALYWWHPVLWWARRELHDAEEQCCDAWVLWAMPDAVRSYGAAILDTVDFVSTNRSAQPALGSTLGEFRHLKRRLLMIRQGNVARAMSGYALLAVYAVGGLALAVAPTVAQQEPPPTEARPQREQADQSLRAQQEAELARARAEEAKMQAERAAADQQRALANQERAQAMFAQAQQELQRAAADAQRARAVRARIADGNPEVAEARQHVQNLRRQLADAERHLAEIAPDDPTLMRRPGQQMINGRLGIQPPTPPMNPGGPMIPPGAQGVAPGRQPDSNFNPPLNPQPPAGYRAPGRPRDAQQGQPGGVPQETRRLDQIEKQLQELAAAVRDLRAQNGRTPSPRDGGAEGSPGKQ
jgi:beta-lactamase regulating signal transducer with metallopeptidase domain